jgi:hypothetical protein
LHFFLRVRTAPQAQPIPPGRCAMSAVEGWRGEIVHWVRTGEGNRIERCKVKDPSINNWPAIVEAVEGNIIADFPVINKSFNLSYSGRIGNAMFKILQKSFSVGSATADYPNVSPRLAEQFRGCPEFDFAAWSDARPAAEACPTGAIALRDSATACARSPWITAAAFFAANARGLPMEQCA